MTILSLGNVGDGQGDQERQDKDKKMPDAPADLAKPAVEEDKKEEDKKEEDKKEDQEKQDAPADVVKPAAEEDKKEDKKEEKEEEKKEEKKEDENEDFVAPDPEERKREEELLRVAMEAAWMRWTPQDAADYFVKSGGVRPESTRIFLQEHLTGLALPEISEEQLRGVGFTLGEAKSILRTMMSEIFFIWFTLYSARSFLSSLLQPFDAATTRGENRLSLNTRRVRIPFPFHLILCGC